MILFSNNMLLLLQPLRCRCDECAFHHERNVREEQHHMYVARTSSNRVIVAREYMVVLRSESPSGKCAKLHSMAPSSNRHYAPRSLYYCLLAPHTCGVVLRAHSVRGETRIHRNDSGEVATVAAYCWKTGSWQINCCSAFCL